MVKEGRTMRAAIEAGNYYRIQPLGGGKEYAPPAAESPAEVIELAKQTFSDIKPGDTFEVWRIMGGTIGGYAVEYCGTITA